ncbi:hypothetical protein NA57DRAFT_66467 [Rhizodiscina lignyota]|uniref:Laccase n=1 Tax=Rhizodiscina lignyota TaxID=1504668 RepID=A0A9P4M9N5_9PEZI|nr:hypothetical protein NA57DRAFT_66467 [Rhizodiscina lignyota]
MRISASLFLLGFGQLAFSALFKWDVTWVDAAPDGFNRPVIGINGQWPCPPIEVEVGEQITVVLTNKLGNETTGLHFHGFSQRGTNQMDGPAGVTQCPIPPGSTFTYSFKADSPGTYWYHSHNMGQFPDGLRGPLIVRDPNAPYKSKISKEYTVTISDWYHDQMPNLLHTYQSTANTAGVEPVPWAGLINDKSTDTFEVTEGETYLFRIINLGAFPSYFFGFEGHNMTIVEMDSVYTEETPCSTLYIGAAQRYTVLVTANQDASKNYGVVSVVDTTMFKQASPNPNFSNMTLGTLSYNSANPAVTPSAPVMPPIDDITVPPLDGAELLGPVTKSIALNFNFTKIDGIQRAIINDVTYLSQKVPSLYTALTVGKDNAKDSSVYGQVNPIIVEYGDIVEIVINNYDNNGHPWHLHGHQFQTVARSQGNVLPDSPYNQSEAEPVPMRRDVAGVRGNGWVALRFRADNPGVQLLHCHIEWHVEAGLTATIIEAPDLLYGGTAPDGSVWNRLIVPPDHIAACRKQGMAYAGNAGGDTQNPTDTYGALYKGSSGSGAKSESDLLEAEALGVLGAILEMKKEHLFKREESM